MRQNLFLFLKVLTQTFLSVLYLAQTEMSVLRSSIYFKT